MSEKERTLDRARERALVYLQLRNDLEEAREEMVEAIFIASENGNAQEEIAVHCSFPEIDDSLTFSRSRIQQFIRERRARAVEA